MKLAPVLKSLSIALVFWMSSSLPVAAQSQPSPDLVYGAQVKVAQQVVETVKSYAGAPFFRRKSKVARGFEGTGYVQAVLQLSGSIASGSPGLRLEDVRHVSYENLLPGDTVFFSNHFSGASHYGFYLGDGEFIHASSGGQRVMISQMKFGYYRERFEGGGRLASLQLAG